MGEWTAETVIESARRARERRTAWEPHWQECYDYALPLRESASLTQNPGAKRTDRLFDGTAPDAVDQLAASLLGQLTPPWATWFGLTAGPDTTDDEKAELGPLLERATATLRSNFDRSNFAVEMHQCYLDLVTAGTACLLFEEAGTGEHSAFRFTAVPLSQVAFEEGPSARLDRTFRRSQATRSQLEGRFPGAPLPAKSANGSKAVDEQTYQLVEMVTPEKGYFLYMAVLEPSGGQLSEPIVLKQGRFHASPFINFRWVKAPGEIYGRSPVMKALPDIKTANKVVELVLKNASIAVTGIWQADDDGVLNPATIKLVPGTIIPKAVGSAGLKPLEAPGRFDTSQLILDDLRNRIRHALLADRLAQSNSPRMTATEVLERSAEMARLLGATYGRLQSELLTPLVLRALGILKRRGEIEDIPVDGRLIDLNYQSPLARNQSQQEAQNILQWLGAVAGMGPQADTVVNKAEVARWLAKAYGVPATLMIAEGTGPVPIVPPDLPMISEPEPEPDAGAGDLAELLQGVAPGLIQELAPALASQAGGLSDVD